MKVTQYLLAFLFALVFGFNANAQSDLVTFVEFQSAENFGMGMFAGDYMSAAYASGNFSKPIENDSTITIENASFGMGYLAPIRARFNAPKSWVGIGMRFRYESSCISYPVEMRVFHQNGNFVFGLGAGYAVRKERGYFNVSVGLNLHRKVR